MSKQLWVNKYEIKMQCTEFNEAAGINGALNELKLIDYEVCVELSEHRAVIHLVYCWLCCDKR